MLSELLVGSICNCGRANEIIERPPYCYVVLGFVKRVNF